jgi:hypothetical protein
VAVTGAFGRTLTVVQLPAYAPDLNPVEGRLGEHEKRP